MAHGVHTLALAAGVMLMLAACGGRPDDESAQGEHRAKMPAVAAPSATPDASPLPLATRVAPDDDIAQLKQQVALLRREVADIRQQLVRLPVAQRTAEVAPPNPRRDPQARLEAELTEQLRIASAETTFRREPEDARWSQATAATVRSALAEADEAVRNQVRSIECRSQSCRVEISADSGGPLARDLPALLMRLGQSLPNATAGRIDQGNGRQATVLYLSR